MSPFPHFPISFYMPPMKPLLNLTPALLELTDDLSPQQFVDLLNWLFVHAFPVTLPNLRAWRRQAGLPV